MPTDPSGTRQEHCKAGVGDHDHDHDHDHDETAHIHAPWTEEQVAALNEYQQAGYVHPFTGARAAYDREAPVLIATTAGWVERVGGPVVQTWAHPFMADGSWKNPEFERQRHVKQGGDT